MSKFAWPASIKFDDTENDIKEARKAWLKSRGIEQSCGAAGEFLEFMQAYADMVERRRKQPDVSSQSA
jgi:hypothetical protein